jgi:hypothetical protein
MTQSEIVKKLIPRNEQAPHTAILWITFEVQQRLPTGEVSGMPVHKGQQVFKIEGGDRMIAIRKLNELLEQINKCTTTP